MGGLLVEDSPAGVGLAEDILGEEALDDRPGHHLGERVLAAVVVGGSSRFRSWGGGPGYGRCCCCGGGP